MQWYYAVNNRADEYHQLDDLDSLDESARISLGLRQRLQTKRGLRARGVAGRPTRSTINWMELDLEIPFFPRGKTKRQQVGNLEWNYVWRISDTTAFTSDGEIDVNDNEIDLANFQFSVDYSPRLNWSIGTRYIGDETDSHILTFQAEYKLTERWHLQWLEQRDFRQDEDLRHRFLIRRKFKEWYVSIVFDVDESRQETVVSLQLTPVGVPEAVMRF